ncbi:putative Monocarboxylate transporter 7 [Hypsibius exemplaris]|uniref:Monocarboxylate transporter 7 n=1 Tax=Hypsibius exemplaris TaxID=2072580 RepID=A0A9X6NHJ3_HYPEX|nr:putative Monocarboxylate transporter 7 [Hypsibius exemplaris]
MRHDSRDNNCGADFSGPEMEASCSVDEDLLYRKQCLLAQSSNSSDEDSNDLTVVEVPQSNVLVPPDGGWGWFVVLGCFLMNLIVNGFSYSFGVVFMELLEKYDRTSAEIAWVYSLNCVTCSWLGPFATALSNAFSFRSVVVVGGFIYSVGLIASSFMTKLEQLYITYGLISGIGSALVYGPSIIMVGRYFDKRRSLANGLSMAGSGVGSFLIPVLLNILIERYTIHGCILILGALSFHLCVAGLLYRAVPLKRTAREPAQFTEASRREPGSVVVQIYPSTHMSTKQIRHIPSSLSVKEEMYETALYPTRGAGGFILGASLLSIPENIVTVEQRPRRLRRISGKGIRQNLRQAALFVYAWPRHLRGGADSGRLFDFSLLKNRLFLTFSSAVMLSSFGYLSVYLILPAHAQDMGLSKKEAVSFVSIMGVCDLLGRVGFGWFSDFQIIPRKWGFCVMVFAATASVALSFVFATTYIQLAMFAGSFGFCAGSFMVMNAVLTADLFGLERLPSAVGLLITIQGIAFLVGPPIIGAIRDQTGSFYAAFLVISIVMTCGGCLLPLEGALAWYLWKRRSATHLSGESLSSRDTDTSTQSASQKIAI